MSSRGLVYLRPSRMVYVRVCGPYRTTIPQAWDRMLNWLDVNGLNSPVGRGYGLLRDNPATVGADACRYDACIDLDPFFEERASRELAIQTLPGGSYVRARKKGDYAELTRQLLKLHDVFQPAPGLKFDDRRPIVTIYLDDPRQIEVDDLRADLCIPVSTKIGRVRDEDHSKAA